MKIVHIQQYYNDDFGYQENLLPYYQRKLGHDVVMVTSNYSDGFNDSRRRQPEATYYDRGFRVVRLGIWGELRHKFVLFKGLYHQLEQEKPDYIFHHSPAAPSILAIGRYKKRHPECFVAIDNHTDRSISISNHFLRLIYYNIFWNLALKLCDHQINLYFGVTPARCLFLSEDLGVNPNKVRLLPIGTDLDHVCFTETRAEWLKRHQLPENAFFLIHGGKMTPDKQPLRLIEAFLRLPDRRAHLILFGSIDDKDVRRLIRNNPRIHNLGWLNRQETLSALHFADLGIWNTRHTTLLEDALSVGLPMILRNYGSTSHLIDESGLFLKHGTTAEMTACITDLLEHPEKVALFRQKTEKHALDLSYDQIAQESVAYAQSTLPQAIHRRWMRLPPPSQLPNFREIHEI